MDKLKSPTVFIPVKGGLGNQMFFYAFAQYLKVNGMRPQLVWYEYIFNNHHNGVELFDAFNIHIEKISKYKISIFISINNSSLPLFFKKTLSHIYKLLYTNRNNYYQSSPYSFDDVITDYKKKKICLVGFWQNYRYLTSIRNNLIESFNFRLPIDFSQNLYFGKILSSNSVSIHIRRTDYLNSNFKHFNVIKSKDYYLKAIQLIKEKCDSPLFFIFTDDIIWAKRNFISDNYIFVEGNVNKFSYLDIYLMSKCKHNIIANSTFSWWGGWLNDNPSKIVIAPEKWTQQVLSSQLCPPDWIFINV